MRRDTMTEGITGYLTALRKRKEVRSQCRSKSLKRQRSHRYIRYQLAPQRRQRKPKHLRILPTLMLQRI